jgi:ATP-dependent Clp protease adaptor protein ClpS
MSDEHKGSSGGMDEDTFEGGVGLATTVERRVEPPKMYNVLLHNDDYTTMEFVVMVLHSVFYRSEAEAVQIMLEVHQKGVGVAGVFSYEVAESKIHKVERMAREQEFPLRCSMEPVL